jgi:penicillin-insensitive murein endopeptidase
MSRIVALLTLLLVLAAGTVVVAQRHPMVQSPTPPAASAPAAKVAPVTKAAPAPPAVAQPAEPAQAAAPPAVASAPPPDTAPPEASAPSVQPSAPAVAAPTPMPPEKRTVAEPKKDSMPAKTLFAAKQLPSLGRAMAIGYYPRGCLQGGVPLPVTGPTWQVMRLSRNRNWGHPELVKFLERFAPAAAKATGWHGIMVGDMAQPRGGPLPFGHMSHQIGLDVDIWFMPMPDHVLTKEERESTSAINVVADDWKHLNPKTWTPQHIAFIKTAAEQPEVERVLVNAAIKQELCRAESKNASWMAKVRPWYGHHDHIHVRLKCPADSPNCRAQPRVPGDDGCAAKDLEFWFSDKVLRPQKSIDTPGSGPKPLTMADLPPACKNVLDAPERQSAQKSGD